MQKLYRHILFLILLLPLLCGCETDIDGANWPEHEEKLVVMGGIRARSDSLFTYFWLQQTGPLQETFEAIPVDLNDFEFALSHNERNVHLETRSIAAFDAPLFSYYYYPLSLLAGGIPGNTEHYSISMKWKGNNINVACTPPPEYPLHMFEVKRGLWEKDTSVVTIAYAYPTYPWDVSISIQNEVYNHERQRWDRDYMFQITRTPQGEEEQRQGLNRYSTKIFPHNLPPEGLPFRVRYRVVIRGTEYLDCLRATRRQDRNDPDLFDPPGKNPPFNVSEAGIGFFWFERFGNWIEIP